MSQQNFIKTSLFSSSSFRTLREYRYNSCMHASIWLKFGTRIGGLKANTSINFGVSLINTEEVIMHKSKSILESETAEI